AGPARRDDRDRAARHSPRHQDAREGDRRERKPRDPALRRRVRGGAQIAARPSRSPRGVTMRAVVVGSGIGGTAATLLRAHAGVPTTLVEKNRRLGGSCSGYEKQGFKVDIGTHMFCRGDKGPLGDVLRRAGEDGAIEFRRTKDIAEIRFPAKKDAPRYVKMPSELWRMPRFAFDVARELRLSPRVAVQAARLFTQILTMSDDEARSWDGATIEEFIAPYIDHPPTIGIFGFLLGLYFILPYWQVSAGEALLAFRQMAKDNNLSYP